jgi:hypothetical protein
MPANVAAARELGIVALHYTSAGRLREELCARGLVP